MRPGVNVVACNQRTCTCARFLRRSSEMLASHARRKRLDQSEQTLRPACRQTTKRLRDRTSPHSIPCNDLLPHLKARPVVYILGFGPPTFQAVPRTPTLARHIGPLFFARQAWRTLQPNSLLVGSPPSCAGDPRSSRFRVTPFTHPILTFPTVHNSLYVPKTLRLYLQILL
jgi:hypothetical protein